MADQEPLRRGIQIGLIAFAILTYAILIGIPIRLGAAAFPVLSALVALFIFAMLRRPMKGYPADRPAISIIRQAVTAGLIAGALVAALIWLFTSLMADGVRLQPIFDKVVPQNIAALHNVSPGAIANGEVSWTSPLLQIGMMALAGLAGAGLVLLNRSQGADSLRARRIPGAKWIVIVLPFVLMLFVIWLGQPAATFGGAHKGTVRLLLAMITFGSGLFSLRQASQPRERIIVGVLLTAGALYMPFTLDQFQNSVMGLVFIFAMMGLGLNIVVGYAGLLDLGYVAFFAIGAYVYAFISAPFSSPFITQQLINLGIDPNTPLLGFWLAMPVTMAIACVSGALLGIPVLRMRGDYLAIVTLGFGEIIRLFMLNMAPLTNGPRGLLRIAPPAFGSFALGSPRYIFLLALLGAGLIAFAAYRLNDSRLGRAWTAMRDDEDVAQATGINLVRTKLLAFATGATFAGLAGQLYAARQVNIFPENFTLFVSIDALSIIIVGGLGSIPGVVLGALALKGLPEVLRGIDEYRIVAFAALLVIMMIVKPEGIMPAARRKRQLRRDDIPVEESPGPNPDSGAAASLEERSS
jgi:branched-chain amino acid transport system permease protein